MASSSISNPLPMAIHMKAVVLDDNRKFSNIAYCSTNDIKKFLIPIGSPHYFVSSLASSKQYVISINEKLFLTVKEESDLEDGNIVLRRLHLDFLNTLIGVEVSVRPFVPPTQFKLEMMSVRIEDPSVGSLEIISSNLEKKILKDFKGQVICVGQKVLIRVEGKEMCFEVVRLTLPGSSAKQGFLWRKTQIFVRATGNRLKLLKQRRLPKQAFQRDISLDALEESLLSAGVGGMAENFREIVTKAFASRYLPPGLIDRLGHNHVRGMLLHGPPGTGKTLLARTMAKFFDAKIQVVNGPEVFSKWFGNSEENVRELFRDAMEDYRQNGENCDLHFIVIDELDSIARERGSHGNSAHHDSILNQLLTMIDGFGKLNNIFIIGTTNRPDLVDNALLRPGRLQLQLKIDLPDKNGRFQILQIYTKKLRLENLLSPDINLEEIAARTTHWSGADLEAAVSGAFSYATVRAAQQGLCSINADNIKVLSADFDRAMESVSPLIGKDVLEFLDNCREGMIEGLSAFEEIYTVAGQLLEQSQKASQLVTCLLTGPTGSGKSSLAAAIALQEHQKHVNIISFSTLSGLSENGRCSKILQVFKNALKFPQSVIVLDNIEWILQYNAIGPSCSSMLTNTLVERLNIVPPEGRSMLVVGTTSKKDILQKVGLAEAFCTHLTVKPLEANDIRKVLQHFEVLSGEDLESVLGPLNTIPIKKLCKLVELARCEAKEHPITAETFLNGKKNIPY